MAECIFRHLKLITVSLTVFLTFTHNILKAQGKFDVDSSVVLIDAQFPPFQSIAAGDTIRLKKGRRDLLILRNIHGNPSNPVIVINDGKVEFNSDHYFGISVRHCSCIKLSGAGDPSIRYGISILNIQGCGLSIGDFSTDVEVNNIEIGYSLYAGISAKTEPDCDFKRNSFMQKNTVIHDCYIHHSGTEGMYIGSSFYNGQTIICNGNPKVVLPALLYNVLVFNNTVEYSGWDGIQVSSAVNTKIYNNKISFDSQKQVDWQMTGIILGEGSTGSIYNNLIKDGEGAGIFDNGLGDINIYNNIILNPGKNNEKPSSDYGIYIDDKSSLPQMYFSVYNNLILNPRKQGIRLLNNLSSYKNEVANNIIIKNGLMASSKNSEDDYITVQGEVAKVESNFCSNNIDQLFFENPAINNFRLKSVSPLIDAGTSILNSEYTKDYYQQNRIQGNGIDIGPVESSYSKINSAPSSELIKDAVFPNPVTIQEYFTIQFSNELPGVINFNLVNESGMVMKNIESNYFINGNHQVSFETKLLSKGLNMIQISKVKNSNLLRVVKSEIK